MCSDYLRIIRRRVRRIFRARRFVDDLTFRVLLIFPLPPRPSIFFSTKSSFVNFLFTNGLDDTNSGPCGSSLSYDDDNVGDDNVGDGNVGDDIVDYYFYLILYMNPRKKINPTRNKTVKASKSSIKNPTVQSMSQNTCGVSQTIR